jgi:hypothetical protein
MKLVCSCPPRRRPNADALRSFCLAQIAGAWGPRRGPMVDTIPNPFDLNATVHEELLPGGTIDDVGQPLNSAPSRGRKAWSSRSSRIFRTRGNAVRPFDQHRPRLCVVARGHGGKPGSVTTLVSSKLYWEDAMKAFSTKQPRRNKKYLLGALAAPLLVIGQPVHSEVVNGPLTLIASVHEALLPSPPNPTIFDDEHIGDPAEYLYLASQGENLSGRSTNITRAFASALAQQHGAGGVGVTSFIGPDPSQDDPDAIEELAAHATWDQEFTNDAANTEHLSMTLKIPPVEVGLIGVEPFADRFSATETAEVDANLSFSITDAHGNVSVGQPFQIGLKVLEIQVPSGQQLLNLVDAEFTGLNIETKDYFQTLDKTGDDTNPRFHLDAGSFEVDFGTLELGDTLDVTYQLTARGTTHGGEHGFVAFLGDPFTLDAAADNFVLTSGPSTAIPEPATWVLMIVGFGVIAGIAARRAVLATQA